MASILFFVVSLIGGSAFGMLVAVGFQVRRRKETYGRWAFRFMGPGSTYFTASGIGAAGVALYSGQSGPATWFLLCMGIGRFLGLWVCWQIRKRQVYALQHRAPHGR